MNLCEATRNELCLLGDQALAPSELRDHVENCTPCRTFAAKLRLQENQIKTFTYPESPNWERLLADKGKFPPGSYASLARKERTLGKIAVAFALAASLVLAVVGLLTQLNKNPNDSLIVKTIETDSHPSSFPGEAEFNVAPRGGTPTTSGNKDFVQPHSTENTVGPAPALMVASSGSFDDKNIQGRTGKDIQPLDRMPQQELPKGAKTKISAIGPEKVAETNPAKSAIDKNPSRFLAESTDLKRESGSAPGASGLGMLPFGTPVPVLVPERIKTLRNLLDQQRTMAVALARGDIAKPNAPGAGGKPVTFAVKPKADAIVNEYERLVGSQLPNLLGSLSTLPQKQLSLELKPLLEHLQSSESEYSRLAVQYPFDGEWLKQIALLARVGILQIRTAQKEF